MTNQANQKANQKGLTAQQALSLSFQLIREHKLEQAEQLLTQLHNQLPDALPVAQGQAALAFAKGDFNTALPLYKKVAGSAPENANFMLDLAVCHYENGQYKQAAAVCENILQSEAENINALNLGAECYMAAGNDAKAAELYKKALKADSDNPSTLLGHALTLAVTGEAKKAITTLEKLIEKPTAPKPLRANGLLYKALLLLERGEKSRADRLVNDALKLEGETFKPRHASYYYYKENGGGAPLMWSMAQSYTHALKAAPKEGLNLEFGVRFGNSLSFLAGHDKQQWHGFDSFEGLPEDWVEGFTKGAYSTGGEVPELAENITLHKGWFNETLPAFLNKNKEPLRFANIDCDIYSSTRTILENLTDRLQPGSVLVFDEYIVTSGWQDHEYKAFQEWIKSTGRSYKYLSFNVFTKQVAVQLT